MRAWRCVSDGEQEKRTKDQSRFGFSDVFIGKIVFSYSYRRVAKLIFPPCEKAFRKAGLLEEDRI